MPTIKRTEYLSVSHDEDTRKAKQGTQVKVTFIFTDWTEQDYVERLMVANSPKVSVAGILRKMKDIPKEYTYNVTKAGTRAAYTPTSMDAISILFPDEVFRNKMLAKFNGDADALIREVRRLQSPTGNATK